MTSKEYVIWLKGFVEACHEYAPTPKQWDALKDKLAEVKDEPKSIGVPIGVPNITPAPIMPLPYYPNPLDNPYKITCSTGSFGTSSPGFAVTTTPGYGSITYNPSTTTTAYPSGSAWSYTNSTYNPPYTTGGEADYITKETDKED